VRKSGKQRSYKEAFLRFGATDEFAKEYTPVVTESMRNRLRARGIEAPRGACDDRSESVRYPHPRYFAKRVWICLIPKGLTFLAMTKRLQEIEGSRVRGGVAGAVCEVCSS
jgi:hypothetical protein